MRATATLTAFLVLLTSLPARADDARMEAMVAEKNAEMEVILNKEGQKLAAIRFLHRHISDDAQFKLTVNNPAMPTASADRTIEMDKESYINTFIQGTNYIDRYQFSIDTLDTKPLPGGAEAITEEILTERGVMLNPLNLNAPGRNFVSRTRCQTRHAVENGELISRGGECHTEVAFEEVI
ncbi:MAG: hypothetical protein EOM26_01665 [Alphaproteobacteria bacterium]|nr:hypothetical protein [Alphaproteobacteria bacterium]